MIEFPATNPEARQFKVKLTYLSYVGCEAEARSMMKELTGLKHLLAASNC